MKAVSKPTNSEWKDEALKLLDNRPRHITLAKIAKETGVSKRWLEQFTERKVPNPGILYVQAVRNYLLKEHTVV